MPTAKNPLPLLLDNTRVLVLVGEGGVGKTTTAAALALAAALRGRHATVMTVDPAPRLGDVLGIQALQAQPTPLTLDRRFPGSVKALRLDCKGTFDRMVENFASTPEAAARMLANPIYQAVSGSLGGSEHYMAFQRLFEMLEDPETAVGDDELLIVDTPPSANCSELFAAPKRLASLLETGALSLLAEPANILARGTSSLARASLRAVLTVVRRVAGEELHRRITEFAELTDQLLVGLQKRAATIDSTLRAPTTSFVVVTRPRQDSVEATLEFAAALQEMGIMPAAFIVNRVTPVAGQDRQQPLTTRIAATKGGNADLRGKAAAAAEAIEETLDRVRAAESGALERLKGALPGSPQAHPRLVAERTIGTLAELGDLAAELLEP